MKKIIITGGPCVGKSTTIDLLKGEGIHIINEVPRDIIEAEQKKKDSNASYLPVVPWLKFDEFQKLVIDEQLLRESNIPNNTHTVLLDRSLVDILGYCKVANKNPPAGLLQLIKSAGYSKVIFLEQLSSYENDSARKEDNVLAKKIHKEILNAYNELGFEVIIIPAFDGKPEQRAEFVKKHLF